MCRPTVGRSSLATYHRPMCRPTVGQRSADCKVLGLIQVIGELCVFNVIASVGRQNDVYRPIKIKESYRLTVFLAHLSRRLIGELIVYPWSGVRRPSVRPSSVRRPQCSKIFFSETAGPVKAKFYVEPPWVGGTIFCSRHLGHMTKMAATPIYGKNPSKIFFSRTGGPIFTKLGM